MDSSDDLKFRAVFTQGGAFRAKLTEDGSRKTRYYFVLNSNPQADELTILSTSTTQFDLHKNCNGGDDIHIPLSPKDYKEFTEYCLICCNRPKQYNKENLKKQLKKQKWELLPALPNELLQKILHGIAKSKVIPPIYKKMILPEENNI
ncbi:MAG: hypothetical protein LLF92_00140 [Planctomycetaceae bacterium]|nr:hypothetical protein [Planctomycetaceae bacterium]